MSRGGPIRAALFLGLLFLAGALATGCGGSASGKTLTIADIGWTENTAVSALTRVLFEEELGYDDVTIRTSDLHSVFEGVANGDLDAFQDVWLPNQRDLLHGVEDGVDTLDPWYRGQTKQGIGVPSYMDTTSLDQLNESGADLILGIEPGSVDMEKTFDEVMPAYGLDQKLVEASTEGMLKEVDKRYRNREEFAFLAWSPHWMNQRYDIRYLDDPKNAFGELNDPAQLSTILSKGLRDKDPVAYAFMKALTLNEEQVEDLENTINEKGDPLQGARQWVQDNPEVVRPWIEAARRAQQS